jgi:putative membrane protein
MWTMKYIVIIALAGLTAVPATAADPVYQKDPGTTNRTGPAPEKMTGKASALTQKFTTAAASGNTLEIETSRLALKKAQNADVKSFAQMMVDDHTKVGEQMKATLQTAGLPPAPAKMTPKHQDMADKLTAVGTAEFDTQYVAVQMKAHDEAISIFSNYAKSGDNTQLQQFAEATLPSLEKHKTMVEDLRTKVTVGSASQ